MRRPDDRAGRQGQGRQGRLPGRHLADARRRSTSDAVRDERQGLPRELRARSRPNPGKLWSSIQGTKGQVYDWPTVHLHRRAAVLRRLHDGAARSRMPASRARASWRCSATRSPPTTSRRPARSRRARRPASWLMAHGVPKADFNSYGSRRGNHDVMMRGTFANVRIKNLMIPPGADGSREEGGVTLFQPGGEKMFIYDAAMKYIAAGHAHRGLRRRGIRHRLDRATGRPRARSCWASRRWWRAASSASTAPTWSAWACCRCSSRARDSWQSLGSTGDETIDVRARRRAQAAERREARHAPRRRRAAAR